MLMLQGSWLTRGASGCASSSAAATLRCACSFPSTPSRSAVSQAGPAPMMSNQFCHLVTRCGSTQTVQFWLQVRREAWKFLLGLYPADMSAAARAAAMEARRSEYDALQQQWTSISDRQAARFAKWREVSRGPTVF